jgi:type IV pilus assembly protein PilE
MKVHGSKQLAITLIELLVVIAIVGILATVGYSNYTRLKTESRRQDAYTAIAKTEAIIERYLVENNEQDVTSQMLISLFGEGYGGSSSYTAIKSPENYYRIVIEPLGNYYRINAIATVGDAVNSCSQPENSNKGQCPDTKCRVIILENGASISSDAFGVITLTPINARHRSTDSNGVGTDATSTTCW